MGSSLLLWAINVFIFLKEDMLGTLSEWDATAVSLYIEHLRTSSEGQTEEPVWSGGYFLFFKYLPQSFSSLRLFQLYCSSLSCLFFLYFKKTEMHAKLCANCFVGS